MVVYLLIFYFSTDSAHLYIMHSKAFDSTAIYKERNINIVFIPNYCFLRILLTKI